MMFYNVKLVMVFVKFDLWPLLIICYIVCCSSFNCLFKNVYDITNTCTSSKVKPSSK